MQNKFEAIHNKEKFRCENIKSGTCLVLFLFDMDTTRPTLYLCPNKPLINNTMHYNRQPFAQCIIDDPWSHICLNVEYEALQQSRPHAIVNIAGSTILHQHEISFLTGTSNCRAHAFAKMIAAALIEGDYSAMPSLKVAKHEGQEKEQVDRVLWIDSVHSFYTCCGIINDIKQAVNKPINSSNFMFMCLDDLGVFNERDIDVHYHIFKTISEFKPTVIIIDDLDHLTPECGMFQADNFYLQLREYLDFHDVAVLCVAYNLLGRMKGTAGHLGYRIFPVANNAFRVSNRGTTAVVQRVKGISCDDQFECAFTINDKNMPQEVILEPNNAQLVQRFAEANAVQDIFTAVIPQNQSLSPDQLVDELNKRQEQMNRINRNRLLIASALAQKVLIRDTNGNYTVNPDIYSHSRGTDNPFDMDFIKKYIDNLQKNNNIPFIPKKRGINVLTYFNRPARPSELPINHLSLPTNADAN